MTGETSKTSSASQKSSKSSPHRAWWRCRRRFHLTGGGVWCLWYSASVALFTGYLVYRSVRRFLAAASLPWPEDEAPYVALNAYVGLVGASVVVTPFLLLTSLHKVGNLANDGVQLGRSMSTCSSDPPVLPLPTAGLVRMLWTHGPPTAAFLHILSAFCLLLPHTLLDAQLLHAGLLPKTEIWTTDLHLFVPHDDRIAVLATLQPPTTSPQLRATTLLPVMNPVVSEGAPVYRGASRSFRPEDSLYLRSASLLRTPENSANVPDYNSLATKGGNPSADYLRHGSGLNSVRNSNTRSQIPSLGELPVGATIPLSNLDSALPAPTANKYPRDGSSDTIHSSGVGNSLPLQEPHKLNSPGHLKSKEPLALGRGLIWQPVSPEFLNFVLALLFYAIRYPSVFWSSNKCFSLVFSLQMTATGLHCTLLSCAFAILYKLHMMGGVLELHGTDELLLSLSATVVLFVLTVLVLVLSCGAVYAHGYHKFVQFVCRSRQKYHISYKDEPAPIGPYTGHIAGLVLLVLQCITAGPLIWDLSRVYRGSLDVVTLIAVISTIVHIFTWIALWLLFTVKNRWQFKLRVTVARACVSSSRSIKLVNDVELLQASEEGTGQAGAPLLVVGHGRAFAVPNTDHKRAIMGVVQKSEGAQSAESSAIYWHRPDAPTLSPRPTRAPSTGAGSSKRQQKPGSPLSESEDDAGDYALLLEEGGIKGKSSNGQTSKQVKRLSRVPSDARYVDRKQILAYRRQSAEQQQQQQQQQQQEQQHQHQQDQESAGGEEDSDAMPPLPPPPPGLGGPSHDGQDRQQYHSPDSGMPAHDAAIHRSDSTSTTTSSTATNHQPDQSTSSTNTATNQSEHDCRNRCGSDDDLSQLPADPSNFPSYPRPLRAQSMNGNGIYGDSTVVIRRQRNLTRELQPPVDPIYGSRSITSFKEEALYGSRAPGVVESIKEEESFEAKNEMCSDDMVAQAQNAANSQHYGTNSAGSVGYHTASNSSGSSSPVPPPSATPGLATPPPPMAPLYPNHSVYGHTGRSPHHGIYGQAPNKSHGIYGQTGVHQNLYGRNGQNKLPQAPQIPLPPIPQGSIPTNLRYGANSSHGDDGQFPPPPLSSPSPLSPPPGDLYPSSSLANSRYVGGGMGGSGSRAVVVGRSSSLRFAPGTPPRHFTNSLPHVLPRNSHYNTGV